MESILGVVELNDIESKDSVRAICLGAFRLCTFADPLSDSRDVRLRKCTCNSDVFRQVLLCAATAL
jgi:hypothetical protein